METGERGQLGTIYFPISFTVVAWLLWHQRPLVVAAVLGPAFPSDLWQRLAGTQGQIPDCIFEELANRQLVFCEPSGHRRECFFYHALIQEVMYDSLLSRTRLNLHERVAQTIEQGTYWPVEQQAALPRLAFIR